ncbi:MAG: hypothetical protein ACLUI3_07555 [Christensenellales bacterium]
MKLMRVPGLYRLVPGLFTNGTRKMFGETAGSRRGSDERRRLAERW